MNIFQINSVILSLVFFDFFLNGAVGTIGPFFAIFISENVAGGTIAAAGIAVAIYWIVKSIVQLPIARWLDKTDGETDDFWALFIGYLGAAVVPMIYFFSTNIWHVFAAQAFFGFCMAWAVPAWFSIFTRHLDKFRIGFEWSLYSVFSVGAATAISGVLGGFLAEKYGFRIIFVLASVLMLAATLGLLTIRKRLYRSRASLTKVIPERKMEKR